MSHLPGEHPWSPLTVQQVVDLLADGPGRWWLSGGQAIDEFLGFSSRSHGDVDVTVARQDWPALHVVLRQVLDVWIARDGHLHSVESSPVRADVDNLWARWPAGGPWRLQVNLEEISAGEWSYRRDRRISRPLDEASWWSGRVRCIAPAVQLLWKAKAPVPKDERDYELVVPRLPTTERTWLGEAIRLAHPTSPWAARPELSDR